MEITRREFLKFMGLGGAAVILGPLVACAPTEQETHNILERFLPEQLQSIKDRTWESLTKVLNEDLFSKESLNLSNFALVKGNNLQIAKEEFAIKGVLTGKSRQLGVKFSLNFAKDLNTSGEGIKFDIAENEDGQSQSVIMGDRMGQGLEIGYFTGENAGDVDRHLMRSGIVRNPQDMKKRFENVTEMLKNTLKIPQDTPFVPEQDFNGFATFVDQQIGYHQIGYGLFLSSREIDGKSVIIKAREGMLVDNEAWRESSHQYRVVPSKISFKELVGVALTDLERNSIGLQGGFRYVKDAPATEHITNLGQQYLPNQAQVENR